MLTITQRDQKEIYVNDLDMRKTKYGVFAVWKHGQNAGMLKRIVDIEDGFIGLACLTGIVERPAFGEEHHSIERLFCLNSPNYRFVVPEDPAEVLELYANHEDYLDKNKRK